MIKRVAAVALAAIGLTATSTQGRPRARVASGIGYQRIYNEDSRLCMGIQHGSTQSGAHVRQGTCNGKRDQIWLIEANATGSGWSSYWTLQNYKSGLCLDVWRNKHRNGEAIVQWICDRANKQQQQFGLSATSDSWDSYSIHYWRAYSSYCIASPGGTHRPANIILWQCGSAFNNAPVYTNFRWINVPGGASNNQNPNIASDRRK